MPEKNYIDNILHDGLVPAPKALELVLEGARFVGEEVLALSECHNRILSKDVASKRDQPPFNASAMDGYAVRFEDVINTPCTLKLIGQSAAGHPFSGSVEKGQTVRIFTGAELPKGADTIVIQENTKADDTNIEILKAPKKAEFVRPLGLDFKIDEVLLTKGTRLSASNLSLAASMNHACLTVYTKPLVAILATGDELMQPGETLQRGQIISSNSFGISAIAKDAGADILDLGIAKDTMEDLKAKISTALEKDADLIVTSGGASVGDHDLIKPAMEHFGFVFSFIKIAMKPGKPVIFGKAMIEGKERRFLGLAGNPVSSLVSSTLFLKPLIHALSGDDPKLILPLKAKLSAPLPKNGNRQDHLRANVKKEKDGSLYVEAYQKQDSSMLATFNKSNCLIVREIDAMAAQIGDLVEIIPLKNF